MPIVSPEIATRDEFPRLCIHRGLLRLAVEVGCLRGTFADIFLAHWPGETLVSIDPWQPIGDYQYDRRTDLQFALQRLARHGDRIDLQPEVDSEDLAERICRRYGKPEFVFLDGDHTKEGTAKSIEIWWRRVTENGILAGHDYCDTFPGVIEAVDEFVQKNGLTLYLSHDAPYASWYVYKDQGTQPLNHWKSFVV
jgi:hypothetical protein